MRRCRLGTVEFDSASAKTRQRFHVGDFGRTQGSDSIVVEIGAIVEGSRDCRNCAAQKVLRESAAESRIGRNWSLHLAVFVFFFAVKTHANARMYAETNFRPIRFARFPDPASGVCCRKTSARAIPSLITCAVRITSRPSVNCRMLISPMSAGGRTWIQNAPAAIKALRPSAEAAQVRR